MCPFSIPFCLPFRACPPPPKLANMNFIVGLPPEIYDLAARKREKAKSYTSPLKLYFFYLLNRTIEILNMRFILVKALCY
jgi:hypothetical protein